MYVGDVFLHPLPGVLPAITVRVGGCPHSPGSRPRPTTSQQMPDTHMPGLTAIETNLLTYIHTYLHTCIRSIYMNACVPKYVCKYHILIAT